MCFRCEFRAKFLEVGGGPRSECGDIRRSKIACYMFIPCFPIKLEKASKRDPRPEHSAPIISARSKCVKLLDPKKDDIRLVKTKSGFLTWKENNESK